MKCRKDCEITKNTSTNQSYKVNHPITYNYPTLAKKTRPAMEISFIVGTWTFKNLRQDLFQCYQQFFPEFTPEILEKTISATSLLYRLILCSEMYDRSCHNTIKGFR
ncbi:CLUMA_CG021432, isoform A [Clunio marinus]|uniref:CLUMA_CG021432, isoform A n=1 Tax=Clunio marinus TaxID=568069 RepID=A0A1J1J7N5_9DIPT|nr:CLUMA_CG021432, isoform A [Clunio marinus]